MLSIKQLKAGTEDKKTILNGLSLDIQPGEVHAIMGPNGSGKSTLSNLLAGKPDYHIISGDVRFKGEDLLKQTPDERAKAGLFLAFQYPIEIPGVNNLYFLRTALNHLRKSRGQSELDAFDFLKFAREKAAILDMKDDFLNRALNVDFSGGEKKRNEILQMLILEPDFIILDEIDSGLDIDALQLISKAVNMLRNQNRAMLIITHYQRLLNYIEPDYVHIMAKGQLVQSGGKELAERLEAEGYAGI